MSGVTDHSKLRVISNYLRLLTTFVTGILVIRLLAEIGPSALVVYLLIVAGTGIAYLFKIVVQESVIPVLGLSYDEKQPQGFASVYWVVTLASGLAALFAVIIFAVIFAMHGTFDTGALSVNAFGIALGAGAIRTLASALTTPALNGILVTGRVVHYNVLVALERLVDLAAVLVVLWFWQENGEETQANAFFVLSAIFYVCVQMLSYHVATRLDGRYRIRPAKIGRADLSWVGGIFGWNTALVVAFLLYLRLSTLVVNASFGQTETLILGLVFMLVGYQRQIAMGLVIGLDAMMSRLVGGGLVGVRVMVMRSTWVQSVFSFFSLAVLVIWAPEIFSLWLGQSLSGTDWDLAWTVELFRIMAIGILARSLSESWMKFLSGKGQVGRFARYILIGGAINAAVLIWLAMVGSTGREALRMIAISYAVLHLIVHIGILPIVMVREFELPVKLFVLSVCLPGLVAVVSGSIALALMYAWPGVLMQTVALGLILLMGAALLLPSSINRIIQLNSGKIH
jgi:hypothetical protein